MADRAELRAAGSGRRARRRDPAAVGRRLADERPRVGRRPPPAARLALTGESGPPLDPLARRSRVPEGGSPVAPGDGGHRRGVSVIGAAAVPPAAGRPGLDPAARPGGYFDGEAAAGFLRGPLEHLLGDAVVVVWGGGPDHKGKAVGEFLERNKRLTLERLPPYSPDLNPVEAAWSWLKYGQLANYFAGSGGELGDEAVERLLGLKSGPGLLRLPWGRSGLPLPHKPDESPRSPAGQ